MFGFEQEISEETVSELQTYNVRITLLFSAHNEKLFDAWTKPDVMQHWLFIGPHSKIKRIDNDLRVGGRFSIVEQTATYDIDHFGEYTIIDRPHRLSFTLEAPAYFEGRTNVNIEFKHVADACEMIFTHEGVAASIVEKRWREMFINLTETLVRK